MYSGYTLWWPWVNIAGAYLYYWYTLCTLDTHCYDDPGYTLLVLIYITIPYLHRIHIVMMTLGIHCCCLSISLYLMYSRYTLLWWPWVYVAGAYLYYLYTLCTLDTHCYDDPGYNFACAYLYHYYTLCTLDTHWYDDPGYTLVVLIYIAIPFVHWIHIVMMTLGIHCCCLSISLYLMFSGYTLWWWPWVYIAGAYLYYLYTLCTLDTHCYDDPGYTLLVLIYITIPYVPWIHIVMTLSIHCWCLSISLLYLMYSGYTLLWWPWVNKAGA